MATSIIALQSFRSIITTFRHMPDASVLQQVLAHSGVLILGIIVKSMLVLELGVWIVRLLHWVPVRGIFRSRVPAVAGNWDQCWDTDSANFSEPVDRHGHTSLRQFFRYC